MIKEKKLKETVVLNEFRINKSIADTVFINGHAIIYEIKTELDNPEKLFSQINDYHKAFEHVYVVTHHSLYYKYYQLLKNTDVGLMYLDESDQLIIFKQSKSVLQYLDHTVLFKLLRKNEYSMIIKKVYGAIPEVPNTLYFKSCLALAQEMPILEFYGNVINELKKRKADEELINDKRLPEELKYICYSLNLNKFQFSNLLKFLKTPFNA